MRRVALVWPVLSTSEVLDSRFSDIMIYCETCFECNDAARVKCRLFLYFCAIAVRYHASLQVTDTMKHMGSPPCTPCPLIR